MSFYRLYIKIEESNNKEDILVLDSENAGFDIAISNNIIKANEIKLVGTNIHAAMYKISGRNPEYVEYVEYMYKESVHYWFVPRSSIYKTGLIMANSIGVIDKSYRGELKVPLYNTKNIDYKIEDGTKLMQIVAPNMGYIKEVYFVKELSKTNRGENGFGSTGLF